MGDSMLSCLELFFKKTKEESKEVANVNKI